MDEWKVNLEGLNRSFDKFKTNYFYKHLPHYFVNVKNLIRLNKNCRKQES